MVANSGSGVEQNAVARLSLCYLVAHNLGNDNDTALSEYRVQSVVDVVYSSELKALLLICVALGDSPDKLIRFDKGFINLGGLCFCTHLVSALEIVAMCWRVAK